MADGTPKDYSIMYCDSFMSLPSTRPNVHPKADLNIGPPELPPPLPPIAQQRTSSILYPRTNATKSSTSSTIHKHDRFDGCQAAPKHREQLDLAMLVAKLKQLPKEDSRAYAMGTLSEHYTSFTSRRKVDQIERAGFKVYIQYLDEKDTYIVRSEQSTLRAIKDKMPMRGNYRYFFRSLDSTYEELEFDDSLVPYHDKDGLKHVYCQVFPS